MGIPVSALLRRMSGREFAGYMHFYKVEPWGVADRTLQDFGEQKEAADFNSPEAIEARLDRGFGRRR